MNSGSAKNRITFLHLLFYKIQPKQASIARQENQKYEHTKVLGVTARDRCSSLANIYNFSCHKLPLDSDTLKEKKKPTFSFNVF